eukprot:TRINITY_DN11927_c0_g3_i10.p1 TRINITY_DN11927_c0_g3~~TRINITY_DN11927_c0_g3_i10.p1  ORF type:complete len:327 (+),score=57.78 TRINITY_DN11927_c0_g3_i10:422-1402(+)
MYEVAHCDNNLGYDWWVLTILNAIHSRPHMLVMNQCQHVVIKDLHFYDSPQFHLRLHDIVDFRIHGIEIKVDVEKQRALLAAHDRLTRNHSQLPDGIPTFPLNTDGIDPAGRDIHIFNVTIENFDDAVAVKPLNNEKLNNKTSNVLVESSTVRFGVGMTIGSVPPHIMINTVENVVFRNIVFEHPIKGIYIKSNPGDEGGGLIRNISYTNIFMQSPLWWAIYIGPQQQKQPDGAGPGCMIYPLNPNCPTNPRVTISDISLTNVTVNASLLSPGIIRCNVSNPCSTIVFDTVHASGGAWPAQGYICEHADIKTIHSSPTPTCIGPGR